MTGWEPERGRDGATRDAGGPGTVSAAQLLPVVYEELRRLAGARLAREAGDTPVDPTSLVHAAYLRIVSGAEQSASVWSGRGHFFGAAAIAMRRILVERARERAQVKDGGGRRRVTLVDFPDSARGEVLDMLALHEALEELERADEQKYRVVMLRYFAGLSIEQAGEVLGLSTATVKRHWTFSRLWLVDRMRGGAGGAAGVEDE